MSYIGKLACHCVARSPDPDGIRGYVIVVIGQACHFRHQLGDAPSTDALTGARFDELVQPQPPALAEVDIKSQADRERDHVLEFLRRKVKQIESGEIAASSVSLVIEAPGGRLSLHWSAGSSITRKLGALELLKHEMLKDWDDTVE